MPEALIIEAVRTPIGRFRGALAGVRPDDLGAQAIKAAVERTGLDPAAVSDVYWGAANQAGEDNRNAGRMAALLAGLPVEVPGVTVNRLCASGLEAVNQASRALRLGEGDVYLAGGGESMSRAPWVLPKPEAALDRGPQTLHDTALGWRLVNPRMAAMYSTEAMGETAENVAERYHVSREDQDAFALRSHQRAVAATANAKAAKPKATKADPFAGLVQMTDAAPKTTKSKAAPAPVPNGNGASEPSAEPIRETSEAVMRARERRQSAGYNRRIPAQ